MDDHRANLLAAFVSDLQPTRTAITGLREFGYSWADIAMRLGITRQGAQQRWGNSPAPVTDTSSTPNWESCP